MMMQIIKKKTFRFLTLGSIFVPIIVKSLKLTEKLTKKCSNQVFTDYVCSRYFRNPVFATSFLLKIRFNQTNILYLVVEILHFFASSIDGFSVIST